MYSTLEDSVEKCLLDTFNDQERDVLLPVIIIVVGLCALSSLGNGLSLFVYATKFERTNSRCFFICLSAVELMSSIIIMPLDVYRLLHQYVFYSDNLCNTFIFFNASLVEISCLLLVVVAVERYRKVCCPFKWQLSLWMSRGLCLLLIPVGVAVAVPSLFLYGPQPIVASVSVFDAAQCLGGDSGPILRNITVFKCTVNTELRGGQFSRSYAGYFCVSTALFLLMIFVCYWKIIRKLKSQDSILAGGNKFQLNDRKSLTQALCRRRTDMLEEPDGSTLTLFPLSEPATSADESAVEIQTADQKHDDNEQNPGEFRLKQIRSSSSDALEPRMKRGCQQFVRPSTRKMLLSDERPETLRRSVPSILEVTPTEGTKPVVPKSCQPARNGKRKPKRSRARKVTRVMLIITATSLSMSIPYLVLAMVRSRENLYELSLSNVQRLFYSLCLRSYLVKSAVNPFVYGLFDTRYRAAVVKMFRRV